MDFFFTSESIAGFLAGSTCNDTEQETLRKIKNSDGEPRRKCNKEKCGHKLWHRVH